mmetsp:Transcript_28616/g.67083  ORF Transcript_28616/g.67083 Transcript_28616/m.67083 type:complete len:224 (+) Transcript_28616:365-1036(+)
MSSVTSHCVEERAIRSRWAADMSRARRRLGRAWATPRAPSSRSTRAADTRRSRARPALARACGEARPRSCEPAREATLAVAVSPAIPPPTMTTPTSSVRAAAGNRGGPVVAPSGAPRAGQRPPASLWPRPIEAPTMRPTMGGARRPFWPSHGAHASHSPATAATATREPCGKGRRPRRLGAPIRGGARSACVPEARRHRFRVREIRPMQRWLSRGSRDAAACG